MEILVTSAGNQASSEAFASGKGYNFFGVANVLNDGDCNRCNDVISPSSSWKNPTSPHSDREVPEIAAPGSRHALLGSSFGGTSCATPVAASIAAVLMSHNPSLKIWPEAIRAILLATANYQLADGANWSKSLDGKDGILNKIPEQYRFIYLLNPFATLFNSYRDVVIEGRVPDFWMLGYVVLLGSVVLAVSMVLVRRCHGVLPMHV